MIFNLFKMTQKNNRKTPLVPLEKNPEALFNTLVKLPGVEFDDEEICKFLDTYFNSNLILQGTKNTKDLEMKINIAVLGKPLLERGVDKSRVVLDKALMSLSDLVVTLNKTLSKEYLKDSTVIFNVYTLIGYETSTPYAAKGNHSPYVIDTNIHGKGTSGYQVQTYGPSPEVCSITSTVDTNLVISFTGTSKIDFGPVFEAAFKPQKLDKKFNNHHGIGKYILYSQLIRSAAYYAADPMGVGQLLEKFVKPKFLTDDFEFVAVCQENFANPYFSKGCEELKEGLWLTNPLGYEYMKNSSLVKPKEVSLTSFKNLVSAHLIGIKPIGRTGSESTVARETSSHNAVIRQLSIDSAPVDTNMELLRNKHLLKLSPAIISIVKGVFVKEFITSRNVKIPVGSTVAFTRSSSKNSLDNSDPYMCTIKIFKEATSVVEVFSIEDIANYMVILGNQKYTDFFEKYQLMKKDFYLEPTGTPFMEGILLMRDLLSEANSHLGMEKILETNYIIEMLKVNGFKKYNYSVRAIALLILEHVYYQRKDYSKFNIMNTMTATMLCSHLQAAFLKDSLDIKIPEPFKVKLNTLLPTEYNFYD